MGNVILDNAIDLPDSGQPDPQGGARNRTKVMLLQRCRDYVYLTKPRIAFMALLTVAVGYFLASPEVVDWIRLLHVLVGAGLVAAGTGAFNQVMERQSDALMARTSNRPLPSGRITSREAFCLGVWGCLGGTLYLVMFSNLSAVLVAVGIQISYLLLYTPLKRRTTLNTAVGAVSGALPPVLGWVAVRDAWDLQAGVLFLILFVWQFPHFLSIAWIYREDYSRAGMKMLSVGDVTGKITGFRVVAYSLALLPVTLVPSMLGHAGAGYFIGATLLGIWFLWFAIRFCFSSDQARSLLRASVLYLPVLLAMLMLDQSGIDSRTRETFAERATTADVPQEGTLNQQDTNILAARKVLSP